MSKKLPPKTLVYTQAEIDACLVKGSIRDAISGKTPLDGLTLAQRLRNLGDSPKEIGRCLRSNELGDSFTKTETAALLSNRDLPDALSKPPVPYESAHDSMSLEEFLAQAI